MTDTSALLELLSMLLADPRYSILLALLLIACVSDCRSLRIPNWLTIGGSTFALLYSWVLPFSPQLGFGWALGGLALGLCFMLPLYMLGVMGAGDVKLMAMVGAFLGLTPTLYAVLFVFVCGGLSALAYSAWRHALPQLLRNVQRKLQSLLVSTVGGTVAHAPRAGRPSVGRMPYALSIALGTLLFLLARQLGHV
jgi:prepilin peptidase CpaA